MKLNLGSGNKKIEGYDNIDIDDGRSVYPLDDVADNSCREIRASHILEHFSHARTLEIIKHWYSKLTADGVIKIAVPDFKNITQRYLAGEKLNVLSYIMGGQIDEYDYHKAVFDENSLREILKAAGFVDIKKWHNTDIEDCASLPISLNLTARKPSRSGSPDILQGSCKVGCVISMPRLGFTDNMNCIIRELAMRGIITSIGKGAYWSQVLTNIIEDKLNEGCDYLLTLDYDTWFNWKMVQKMLNLAILSDADCIVPMQKKRGCEQLLIGADKTQISRAEYDNGLFEVTGGHFGCTLFKASSFAELKKPWFIPKPDQEGGWRDGRIDADINFWRNAVEAGWKMYLATKVKIGHIELKASFAGSFEDQFKPVYADINDLNNDKLPAHIEAELNEED